MDNYQSPMSAENDVFSSSKDSSQWSSPSRIHFPINEPIPSRTSRHRSEGPGLTPPMRRGSPLNPQNATFQLSDLRRRSGTSDAVLIPSDPLNRHRRNPSFNHGGSPRLLSSMNITSDDEQETGVFSDEYDLSHEDPRILQDVQRALKLKAKREARLKRESTTNTNGERPESHEPMASPPRFRTPTRVPSLSTNSSPSFYPPSSRKSSANAPSEVDFSPSTGFFDSSLQSHPVPLSSDNGKTLDWTGSGPEDGDKRRIMGLVKKKEKDKMPLFGLMIEQNEQMHESKLVQLKNHISEQSWRKAGIISDQIFRRYQSLDEAFKMTGKPINLLSVARWNSSRDEGFRRSLEKAEPFTWLKHLEKRSPRYPRSPWHLSALIMESHAHATDRLQPIPENSTTINAKMPQTRNSRSPSFLSSRGNTYGSSTSMTIPTDDRLSFEPFAEGRRNSLDLSSRKSVDSAPSSFNSASSTNPGLLPLSPTSIRSNKNVEKLSNPISNRSQSPGSSSSDSKVDSLSLKELTTDALSLSIPQVSILPPSTETISPPPVINHSSLVLSSSQGSSNSSQAKPIVSPSNQSLLSLRASSRTRPSRGNNSRQNRTSKKSRQERENDQAIEYERKARLLQETIAHNNRIRQSLNRISTAMKEFDLIQNASIQVHGLPKVDIPRDLLEAFGHDPSAVTGPTRRDQGWRAVEDINQRVERQRALFRGFIKSFQENPPNEGCALDEAMNAIINAFEGLQEFKAEFVTEEEQVSSLLTEVQTLQAGVKDDYNATVSMVSNSYPELSTIIALEESYKDQYQQFWELGMDALTLLLDTVTPFWRTYGKTIGEDVRDFFIIPLYRNEFTGEAKSYPIRALPKRSMRHWLGLVLFFLLSIIVNILQFRGARSSTAHFRLHLIPYNGVRWTALPFFWVGIVIQWLAVICEMAIVFFQLVVIAWWTGWSVKLVT